MNNPYADSGSIVSSDRYIIRSETERTVESRLIGNDSYGSVGVVGMQRMGKSSLANHLLISKKKELLQKHVMVINMSMYDYRTPQAFFTGMVEKTFDILEDNDVISNKIERRFNRAMDASVTETGGERIRSFFEVVVSDLGYRVICIIDEFDYVKKLFEEYPEGFFVLRELAYQPGNKIGFLFLSRRLMAELEAGFGYDVSNFSGIMFDCYLGPYNEKEQEQYFEILKSTGVPVTDEIIEDYREITGNMPYWMDLLSMHYVESFAAGEGKNLYKIFDENEETFYKEFGRMFELLKEQNLLNALYQVILGPVGDEATPQNIRRLENYGIILKSGKGYETISRYFRRYLVMKEQTVEFYPLWNRTEKLLRAVGAQKLKEEYGESWEDAIKAKYVTPEDSPRGHSTHMTVGDHILAAQIRIEDMKKKTAIYDVDPAGINLLNGTTTGGLAEILLAEYDRCYKKVFNMKRGEFQMIINSITSARNPYDHNNDNMIRDDVKEKTIENCRTLCRLIEANLNLK
ncbi:ATP-binding protein [Butyrivibrio sp. FCS014]|uniref:ATP-binding protein n=1 Tax=Butyrivibrio sp. FCS014 TaxID=1408304 RepID=UPI0004644081|nr:ATP-binding protein [Butyrivibrio sp. FCS014]